MKPPRQFLAIDGHPYLIADVQDVSRREVDLRQKQIEDGWLYTLRVQQFDDSWETIRQWVQKNKMNATEANLICQREAKRQERLLAEKSNLQPDWTASKPLPDALRQAALDEIFGSKDFTDAETLARLEMTFRRGIASGVLAQWDSADKIESIKRYLSAKRDSRVRKSTVRGRVALSLICHWQRICRERMTTAAAHKSFATSSPQDADCTLDAFTKILQRFKLRLASPGRPRK